MDAGHAGAKVTPISPAAAEALASLGANDARTKAEAKAAKKAQKDQERATKKALKLAEKEKAAALAEQEKLAKLPVFESTRELSSRLVKALDAEESARAKRKDLGVRFRDEEKAARDAFEALVADLDGTHPVKKALKRLDLAEEGAVEARKHAKKVKGESEDTFGEARGKLGDAWKAITALREKRADQKGKAGKKLREAEAEVSELVTAAKKQATQLQLAL